MIPRQCIEVQTSPVERPSVPPWLAEVAILAQHLATKGLLEAFTHQIRLVRGHFGHYEPIDFLVLLIGYAISGERRLSDFFERLSPFGAAFMALFGRANLPHRSSLSRFLADVDRPCLEAFRTLFEQFSFPEGWTSETIGGLWDRQGRHYIVFDVDATRQAAPQRGPLHTRQWIGTYGNRGNGDYQAELASALQAIKTYLAHFALTTQTALVRLDGQYGDAVVIAQLIEAGVYLITRGRTYGMLERPELQRVLTHPPSARVTALNTGEVVELFDGGWLDLDEGLPRVRVIVARHAAPPPGRKVRVGKRVGEWVYELFITTLPVDGFLVEDALDLYHGRGAFEAVLADEDVEEDPDRWCSYTDCGQELWQIACQWVWNLRLSLGKMMQGDALREIEWAPPKEATLLLPIPEPTPEEYGQWQLAGDVGRARGQIAGEAFVWQEDGKLRCPAGASLWLSEVRQENAFTQRAVYLAYQTDCQPCSLREQCLAPGAKGNRARRVSVVRRLLPQPSSLERQPILLVPMRWVDVAGRTLRRRWTARLSAAIC